MDARIQAYLRGAAARGRETERIGPFLATFDLAIDNPFLNYAIPDDGAQPSAAEVQALAEAYARRVSGRGSSTCPPRHRGEDALRAAGFEAEGLLPLMTRPCDRIVDQPRLEGVELLTPSTDEELQGATAAQSEAFGGPPLSDANAELMPATIAAGGIAVAARELAPGRSSGRASAHPPPTRSLSSSASACRPSTAGAGSPERSLRDSPRRHLRQV